MTSAEVIPVIRSPEQTYILKPEKPDEVRKLNDEARNAVEKWYLTKGPEKAMEDIKNKDTLHKQRKEDAQKAISLEEVSDDDLIVILKHRDDIMRGKAVSILFERIRNEDSEPQRVADLTDKLRSNLRLLIGALHSDDKETLTRLLSIFTQIIDDKLSAQFRILGGIGPLCKIASLPFMFTNEELATFFLFTVYRLSSNEENRDTFRSQSGIIPLVPFLKIDFPKPKLLVTGALLNLSFSEKNQPVIARAGAVGHCFQNLIDTDNYKLKLDTLYLLRNLAYCEEGRNQMSQEYFEVLLDILDPRNAYPTSETEGTPEFKQDFQIQKILLHLMLEMCTSDRNKAMLGMLGAIKRLIQFFAPLSDKSPYRWNFEILERVLGTLDKLVTLDELRSEFLDARGQGIVACVVQKPTEYPEECILNAAQIITTIATNANTHQQNYANQGINMLLGLHEQFPDKEVVQNLVSKLLKSISVDGGNSKLVIESGGVSVLMNLVRESRVRPILINSTQALGALSSQEEVANEIMQSDLLPTLVGFLQLNLPELQAALTEILYNVSQDENGAKLIVKNGGVVPLVTLLSSKNEDVLEGSLITLSKILFHRQYGVDYRRYFFNADGHKRLLELMDHKTEKVHIPALTILSVLTNISDGLDPLREIGIQVKVEELERLGYMDVAEGQSPVLLRTIKVNLKNQAAENRRKIEEEAEIQRQEKMYEEEERKRRELELASIRAVQEEEERKRTRKFFIKVEYEAMAKMFPVTVELTYSELLNNICAHFGINSWKAISFKDGHDDIALDEQSDLDYLLDAIAEGKQTYITVHPVEPIPKDNSDKAAKLDELLQELNPRQLRELIKLAVSGGANIVGPLKQYLGVARTAKQNLKTEKVQLLDINALSANKPATGGPAPVAPSTSAPESVISPPPGRKTPLPPAPPAPLQEIGTRQPAPKKLSATESPGNLIDEIRQGKQLKKTEPGQKPASRDSLIDAIKAGVTLKHVETVSEQAPIRNAREGLMDEIRASGSGSFTLKLLDQGLQEGKKFWVSQPERYVEELEKAFLLDYKMIDVVFQLSQTDENVSFLETHKKLKDYEKITQGQLAEALLLIGFNVRSRRFYTKEEEKDDPLTEYTNIIPPSDLPVPIILKTILALTQGLPDEYKYDVIKEEISFVDTSQYQEEETLTLSLPLPGGGKK